MTTGPRILTIIRSDDAAAFLKRVEAGELTIIREVVDGRMCMALRTRGGQIRASVGVVQEKKFETFLQAYGNRDGLFDGFDQTAGAA